MFFMFMPGKCPESLGKPETGVMCPMSLSSALAVARGVWEVQGLTREKSTGFTMGKS